MSDLVDTLQQRHQEYLDRVKRRQMGEVLLEQIQGLIIDLGEAGEVIADPAERGQLRALIHFWGSTVYDHTGAYPTATLLPLDPKHARSTEEPVRRPSPSLYWILLGAAAAIVIVIGLLVIVQMFSPLAAPAEASPPVRAPIVTHAPLGTDLGEDGVVETAADTFCLGTPDIYSNFGLEELQPETALHWELRRGDEVMSAKPADPWGQDPQYVTIRIPAASGNGVEPGHYDLLLFADDQAVGHQSFEVLETAPRISALQVADVPVPGDETPGERAFEPGVRVVYLNYDYAGLCAGLDLSHTLYRGGVPLLKTVEAWRGAPQGRAQVVFQVSDSLRFTPGDYEIVVTVSGEDQGRVAFTIKEEEMETVKEPEEESDSVPPAFGDISLSLGVQPDGSPVLAVADNQFDWNTKVVYGIFDYIGMRDGMTWTTVWMRNGLEVGRQEHLWNENALGRKGTLWTTYNDEYGRPLAGGNYSVTLYIDNVEQRTAGFRILYYTE